MMHMSFFASKNVQILFEDWKTTNVGGLIGSCIAVFVIAILYEYLKAYKVHQMKSCAKDSEKTPLLHRPNKHQTRFGMKDHAKKTCYYIVQFLVGYFLMLVAMTYNVWLFIAVILGCGLGYFLASPLIQLFFSKDSLSASSADNSLAHAHAFES